MEQIRDNQKRISFSRGAVKDARHARTEIYENCVARGGAVRGEHPSSLVIFLRALKYVVLGTRNRENFVYADPVNYTPCPFI